MKPKTGQIDTNDIIPIYELGLNNILFKYKGNDFALLNGEIIKIELGKFLKFKPYEGIDDNKSLQFFYRDTILRKVRSRDLLNALLDD
jgi:hypothetical protein